jgi:O-antigen/teichoic acid export membrane protein
MMGSLAKRRSILGRAAALSLPLIAAISLRLAQFLVLVILARLAAPSDQTLLLAGFGIVSALGIMSDSGATNFLLANPDRSLDRQDIRKILMIHGLLAAGGLLVAFGIIVFVFSGWRSPGALGVIAAIGLAQCLESLVRASRTQLLIAGSDGRYSVPDFALAAARLILVAVAWGSDVLRVFWLLPVVPLIIFTVVARYALLRFPPSSRASQPVSIWEVLDFGVAGAVSSLYSQAPILVGSLTMPVQTVAVLAVVYRIVQPIEIIPATLSQQLLPRVRRRGLRAFRVWAFLAGIGLLTAGAVWALSPLIENLTQVEFNSGGVVFIAILLSVPLKFGNYALATFAMAHGMVRQRTVLTLMVGILAVVCVVLMAGTIGARGVSFVSLTAEVALLVALATLLRRPRS